MFRFGNVINTLLLNSEETAFTGVISDLIFFSVQVKRIMTDYDHFPIHKL